MAAYMVFFTNISYVVQLDLDYTFWIFPTELCWALLGHIASRPPFFVFELAHAHCQTQTELAPPRHAFHGSTMLCSSILLTYCAANVLGLLVMERLKGSVLVKAKITEAWRKFPRTAPGPDDKWWWRRGCYTKVTPISVVIYCYFSLVNYNCPGPPAIIWLLPVGVTLLWSNQQEKALDCPTRNRWFCW